MAQLDLRHGQTVAVDIATREVTPLAFVLGALKVEPAADRNGGATLAGAEIVRRRRWIADRRRSGACSGAFAFR